MLGAASLTIGHAHVAGQQLDAWIARVRLESILRDAELRLQTVPPSAVLIVRHLDVRGLASIRLSGVGWGASPAWVEGLRSALERMAREAARPALGPVPPSAAAVLFLDDGELLACLAAAVARGEVTRQWWWKQIVTGDPLEAVTRVWSSQAIAVPRAMSLLARTGELSRVLASLTPSRDAIAAALARTYGLSPGPAAKGAPAAPDDAPLPPRDAAPSAAMLLRTTSEPATLVRAALDALRDASSPRATPVVPEPPRSEDVRRTPVAAVDAAARASISPSSPRQPQEEIGTASRADIASSPTPSEALDPSRHEAIGAPKPPAAEVPATEVEVGTPPRASSPEPFIEHPSAPLTAASPPRAAAAPHDLDEPARATEALSSPAAEGAADVACSHHPAPHLEETPWPIARPWRTELGGALFLLNVALSLGLYGDFAHPRHEGLAMSPWDLLSLLTEDLLGGLPAGDELAPLLARLSLRSVDDPPAAEFAPPDELILSREWLAPFPEPASLTLVDDGERARLEHPFGFTLMDASSSTVRARAHEYGTIEREATGTLQAPRARWRSFLSRFVRARLARATGLPIDDVAQTVLALEARIFATATHVDAVFPLARLPLEVRFAGLDRDPGWIPAADRIVSFHFEL